MHSCTLTTVRKKVSQSVRHSMCQHFLFSSLEILLLVQLGLFTSQLFLQHDKVQQFVVVPIPDVKCYRWYRAVRLTQFP